MKTSAQIIGRINLISSAYKEAIQPYLKVLEITRNNGLSHLYLGMSCLPGEVEKAEKESTASNNEERSKVTDKVKEKRSPLLDEDSYLADDKKNINVYLWIA